MLLDLYPLFRPAGGGYGFVDRPARVRPGRRPKVRPGPARVTAMDLVPVRYRASTSGRVVAAPGRHRLAVAVTSGEAQADFDEFVLLAAALWWED